jgi:hypothetical protein
MLAVISRLWAIGWLARVLVFVIRWRLDLAELVLAGVLVVGVHLDGDLVELRLAKVLVDGDLSGGGLAELRLAGALVDGVHCGGDLGIGLRLAGVPLLVSQGLPRLGLCVNCGGTGVIAESVIRLYRFA